MSWVVFVLLGVAAIAAGRHVWLYQEQKGTPGSTTNPEQDTGKGAEAGAEAAVPTCETEVTFCTQEYMPKECTLTFDGRTFKAVGNNGCQAQKALFRTLCEQGITKISTAAASSVTCTSQSEGEPQSH